MMTLDAGTVHQRLGGSNRFRTWLGQLELVTPMSDLELPSDAEATAILTRYGVRVDARRAALAGRPDEVRDPHLWWILSRACQQVRTHRGENLASGWYMGWPSLPSDTGTAGEELYVWAFLALVSEAEAFHRIRGIAPSISLATLSHVSIETSVWSESYGLRGIRSTWMLPIMLQGASFRLGRHMFDRYGAQLNVHIPGGDRLDPAASEASFAMARDFFPRHFPEDQIEEFSCHSWLMDDQWQRYLAKTSNIVQFQRRFVLSSTEREPAEADILDFVFQRSPDAIPPSTAFLDSLPEETTLQRAFVSHLRNGGRWWTQHGTRAF